MKKVILNSTSKWLIAGLLGLAIEGRAHAWESENFEFGQVDSVSIRHTSNNITRTDLSNAPETLTMATLTIVGGPKAMLIKGAIEGKIYASSYVVESFSHAKDTITSCYKAALLAKSNPTRYKFAVKYLLASAGGQINIPTLPALNTNPQAYSEYRYLQVGDANYFPFTGEQGNFLSSNVRIVECVLH